MTVVMAGVLLPTSCSSPRTPSAKASSVVTTPKAKTALIDGVPLIPITSSQVTSCVKFANRLGRPVPCPGLLPKPIPVSANSPEASCLGTLGENACGPAVIQVTNLFLLSQANFQVPPGYIGVSFRQYDGTVVPETSVAGGPLGHFVFTAGIGIPAVPSYCAHLSVPGTVRVRGSEAKFYECSTSPTGPGQLQLILGHELLVWKDDGVTTEISFHGLSQVNRDLDLAAADATFLVKPTAR